MYVRFTQGLLFFLSIALCAGSLSGQAPFPPQGMKPGQELPKLSPEDMKMLGEVEQEINKFVGSLPQEEQQKFWKEVDELTKVMSTMNEDELVKFMEGVLQEQEGPQGAPKPTPMPTPIAEPAPIPQPMPIEKPAEAAPKPVEPSDKEVHAFKLVEAILLMLNNFITKTQAIPELPGKVESWIKEGKLRGAKPGTDWNNLRASVESLMSKLSKIKDRDPISNSYKYLAEMIKDESLINNLQRLKDVLNRHEPKIDISPFGQEKMNRQTRESMRAVINALIETITVLGVPAALDKIIEKYEPIAKKMREQEEAAQRQAVETSRRMPYPTPATVAGRSEERTIPKERDYSKFDFGLAPYKPAPIPMPNKEAEKPAESKKLESKPAGGAAPSEKKPEAAKQTLEAEDKESWAAFETFSKSISEVGMILDDYDKEIAGQKAADEDATSEIQDIPQKMRNGLFGLRQLKRRLAQVEKTKPGLKKTFLRSVEDVMKENKEVFSQLPPAGSATGPFKETLDKAADKLNDIKDVIKEISGAK